MSSKQFTPSQLAIPTVCTLIAFLAYTSQYFFNQFKASPLQDIEKWRINILAVCIWICYYRSCTVDPGRIPRDWKPADHEQAKTDQDVGRQRWCRKCEAFKPPRAHHCRTCQRCVPKMDHHCPWTRNCVSHSTFPHFIRFLFYAVAGMTYVESCLFERVLIVWTDRNIPSYLGPSMAQLAHLFILFVVNSFTLFALFILLVRTLWTLGSNTTTIEGWEIERHKTLLRRARHFGGYLDGPGGIKVRIKRQEFPYDIGIWANIKTGMGGSSNILSWFWPLARTPDYRAGLEYEVNDFEDPNLSWPPPDPDRIPMPARPRAEDHALAGTQMHDFTAEDIQVFNRRKAQDAKRLNADSELRRRQRFQDRLQKTPREDDSPEDSQNEDGSGDGEEGWKNSEGERLRDFGVDEEIEFYDEEDIPLAILMQPQRRRRQ